MSNLNDSTSVRPHEVRPIHRTRDMLNGKTVLVVEEEFLIALDIQRMLEALDSGQTLFARTPDEACTLAGQDAGIGLAIIEVATSDQSTSLDLVRRFFDASIPVVLSTVDVTIRRGLSEFPAVPIILKPMSEDDLVAAVASALAKRS